MTAFSGKRALVLGVANKRSIAWSIAQGLHNAGATLAVTCQNERLQQEANDLIVSLPGAEGFMCDVSNDEAVDRLFSKLKEQYGKLHVLVHSVAFAPADAMKGEFVATSREGFRIAHDVSVYSLVALARAAAPMLPGWLGAHRTTRTRSSGDAMGSDARAAGSAGRMRVMHPMLTTAVKAARLDPVEALRYE